MDKEALLNCLRNGVCEVTFKKVSGEIRTMPCTIKESLIPVENHPKGLKKKTSDSVISVWALDRNAWRSFRTESVIDYKVKEAL